MTTLVENPMPILIFGVLAMAVLGVILLRTQRGVVLVAMLGVLLLVLSALGIEWLVVTDRERVEGTVDGAAAALETNPKGDERARILDRYVAESAGGSRQLLEWALRRVEFRRIKITHMETSVNRLTSPPTARVELTGYATFKDRKGEYPYEGRPVTFTMKLSETQPGRWQISGHEWHDDPR